MSLYVDAVLPPNGYEGTYSGNGTLTPGERNFVVRRIARLTIRSGLTIPVSDGTRWFGVNPIVEFETGEVERLAGTREEQVRATSNNPEILRIRRDSGRPVVEGLLPGTATVVATYWGVVSSPGTFEVVPTH